MTTTSLIERNKQYRLTQRWETMEESLAVAHLTLVSDGESVLAEVSAWTPTRAQLDGRGRADSPIEAVRIAFAEIGYIPSRNARTLYTMVKYSLSKMGHGSLRTSRWYNNDPSWLGDEHARGGITLSEFKNVVAMLEEPPADVLVCPEQPVQVAPVGWEQLGEIWHRGEPIAQVREMQPTATVFMLTRTGYAECLIITQDDQVRAAGATQDDALASASMLLGLTLNATDPWRRQLADHLEKQHD